MVGQRRKTVGIAGSLDPRGEDRVHDGKNSIGVATALIAGSPAAASPHRRAFPMNGPRTRPSPSPTRSRRKTGSSFACLIARLLPHAVGAATAFARGAFRLELAKYEACASVRPLLPVACFLLSSAERRGRSCNASTNLAAAAAPAPLAACRHIADEREFRTHRVPRSMQELVAWYGDLRVQPVGDAPSRTHISPATVRVLRGEPERRALPGCAGGALPTVPAGGVSRLPQCPLARGVVTGNSGLRDLAREAGT